MHLPNAKAKLLILSFFGRPCTNVNYVSQESKAPCQKEALQLVWSSAVSCLGWCCTSYSRSYSDRKRNTHVALSSDTEERL